MSSLILKEAPAHPFFLEKCIDLLTTYLEHDPADTPDHVVLYSINSDLNPEITLYNAGHEACWIAC